MDNNYRESIERISKNYKLPQTELALLYNLSKDTRKEGWKSYKEIEATRDADNSDKTDKKENTPEKKIPEDLKFKSGHNIINILDKLIKKGLVQKSEVATPYKNKPKQKFLLKVWRIGQDKRTQVKLQKYLFAYDNHNKGNKVSYLFPKDNWVEPIQDELNLIANRDYEEALKIVVLNAITLNYKTKKIEQDLNNLMKHNPLVYSIYMREKYKKQR